MITPAADANTTAAAGTSGMCWAPEGLPSRISVNGGESQLPLGHPVRGGEKHSPLTKAEEPQRLSPSWEAAQPQGFEGRE